MTRSIWVAGCWAAAALLLATPAVEGARPLKVFILAGQSNMEGHAEIRTFDYIGDDRATAPLLKQMRGDERSAVSWVRDTAIER